MKKRLKLISIFFIIILFFCIGETKAYRYAPSKYGTEGRECNNSEHSNCIIHTLKYYADYPRKGNSTTDDINIHMKRNMASRGDMVNVLHLIGNFCAQHSVDLPPNSDNEGYKLAYRIETNDKEVSFYEYTDSKVRKVFSGEKLKVALKMAYILAYCNGEDAWNVSPLAEGYRDNNLLGINAVQQILWSSKNNLDSEGNMDNKDRTFTQEFFDGVKSKIPKDDLNKELREFIANLGDGQDMESDKIKAKRISKEAEQFVNDFDAGDPTIDTSRCVDKGVSQIEDKTGVVMGPLSITIPSGCEYVSLSVKGKKADDTTAGNSNFKIGSYKNGTFNEKTPKSGEDFYLWIRSNVETVTELKVNWNKMHVKSQFYIITSSTATQTQYITGYAESYWNTESTPFEVNIPVRVKITINKVDSNDDNIKIEGIGFKLYADGLGWVKSNDGTPKGNMSYKSNISNATTFKTQSDGAVTINNLRNAKYTIYEVEGNPSAGYYLEQQNNYDATNKYKRMGTVAKNTMDATKTYTNRLLDISILKIDETYKTNLDTKNDLTLSGSKMKIYLEINSNNKGWLVATNADGKYTYSSLTSNINSATEFETDKKGNIKLHGARHGKYTVYETQTPTGYIKEAQAGYKKDPTGYTFGQTNNMVYLTQMEINSSTPYNQSYTLTNKRNIKIEGNVWLDNPGTKLDEYNHKYDNSDELLKDIQVHLCKENDETPIATTATDSNGHYKFENIDYWQIVNANCYVKFYYDNTKYITVTPFTGSDSESSKAQENTVTANTLQDDKLTGTEGDNPGIAITDSNILSTYYDDSTCLMENINLGLIEKHDPQYSVKEELAYVKMYINGYTYTYNYSTRDATYEQGTQNVTQQITGNKTYNYSTGQYGNVGQDQIGYNIQGAYSLAENPYVPTTSAETVTGFYTSQVYPSDIAYSFGENTGVTDENKLRIYAVYKITVKNDENFDNDKIYTEKKLVVENLTNTFDDSRYAFSGEQTGGAEQGEFTLWSANGNKATYNGNAFNGGITSGNEKSTYIQFKMKDEAIKKILTGEDTKGSYKNKPSTTEVNAYHEYTRKDNIWNPSTTKSYTGATQNGYNNDQGEYTHKSVSKKANSYALYINFRLGDPRTISGTVFEDKTDINNRDGKAVKLGNGIYDSGEKALGNVKVELLYSKDNNDYVDRPENINYTGSNNNNIVNLYQKVDSASFVWNYNYNKVKAQTVTDAQGKYSFEGVVPGLYYIRFTYGDGTQAILNSEGKLVTLNDYKSTTINEENVGLIKAAKEENNPDARLANLLRNSSENDRKIVEWYKYITEKSSTAVDDLDLRNSFNDNIYGKDGTIKDNDNIKDVTSMKAFTPATSISIENDTGNSVNGDTHSNQFGKFNFGITKVPNIVMDIEDIITNITLTAQVGNTLISDNPSKSEVLRDVDRTTEEGSSFVIAELDPSTIYGASLKAKYQIKITNNSEPDYIEPKGSSNYGYYYMYGLITNDSKPRQITTNQVNSIIDKDFTFDEATKKVSSKINNSEVGKDIEVTLENGNTLTFKDWNAISTGQFNSIEFEIEGKVGSFDDELLIVNDSSIQRISVGNLGTLQSGYEWKEDSSVLSISPPTGTNFDPLFWTEAMVALIVLAGGIVILKKYVIKK